MSKMFYEDIVIQEDSECPILLIDNSISTGAKFHYNKSILHCGYKHIIENLNLGDQFNVIFWNSNI